MSTNSTPAARSTCIAIFVVCLIVSLVCVVYPIYVIRPFRAQGARELAAALIITRFRVVITLVSAMVGLAALAWSWRERPGKKFRILTAAGAGFLCVLAGLARVNFYEWMFHPIAHPSFAAVPQAKLENDEKVLAIKIAGSARAYPVRSIAYHHIVNDLVNKLAIVATY